MAEKRKRPGRKEAGWVERKREGTGSKVEE